MQLTHSELSPQRRRSQDEHPTLYSLVFGEGVVNDATSIVLLRCAGWHAAAAAGAEVSASRFCCCRRCGALQLLPAPRCPHAQAGGGEQELGQRRDVQRAAAVRRLARCSLMPGERRVWPAAAAAGERRGSNTSPPAHARLPCYAPSPRSALSRISKQSQLTGATLAAIGASFASLFCLSLAVGVGVGLIR